MAKDYQALADQHLEEVTQILEEYGAAEVELGHQIQAIEAGRLATGYQTVETAELLNSSPEDTGPTTQEEPEAVTSAPPVSKPTLTRALDSAPCPVTNVSEATTSPPLNMSLQADEGITTEQPAHEELTTDQTTAPADRTPEREPFEPLQTEEPTDAAITEPP